MIRIISFDPGESNFALAVTEHRQDPVTLQHQSRVLRSGLLKSTIRNLKNNKTLSEQASGLYTELSALFDEFEPFDDVALERFMGRGVKVGTTSETTNIMIGVLAHLLYQRYGTPFPTLINAAIWKKEYDKISYSAGLKGDYTLCATTYHQLDAALIGHYRASQLLGVRPFDAFHDESVRDRYMWHIEKVSDEPLTRRRKQRNFYRTEVEWYDRY